SAAAVLLAGIQRGQAYFNIHTMMFGGGEIRGFLAVPVDISIKPGSELPPINTRSRGTIPVAIISTSSFNAVTAVDTTSLTFGRTGSEHSLGFCNAGGEDVNGDGRFAVRAWGRRTRVSHRLRSSETKSCIHVGDIMGTGWPEALG